MKSIDLRELMNSDLKKVFQENKLKFSFLIVTYFLVPLLNLSVLSLIYLILDTEQRNSFLSKLQSLEYFSNLTKGISEEVLIYFLFLVAFVMLALQLIFRYVGDMIIVRLNQRLYIRDAKRILYTYLNNPLLSMRSLNRQRLSNHVLSTSGCYGNVIRDGCFAIASAVQLLNYLVFSIFLSWKIALLSALLYGVPFSLTRRFLKRIEISAKLKVKYNEKLLDFLKDFVDGSRRIKVDALEPIFQDRSVSVLKNAWNWRIVKWKNLAKSKVVLEGFSTGSLLIVFFVGMYFLNVPLTKLIVLFVIFARLKSAVEGIFTYYSKIKENFPQAEKYFAFLARLQKGQILIPSDNSSMIGAKLIELRSVSFAYDEKHVLDDVNMVLNAGDRVLIQGPSGHGKSTLIDIVSGLISPQKGEVLYDSRPINDLEFYNLRLNSILVSPKIYLFNNSIKDNLLMGDPEHSMNVTSAIKLSFLEEMISEMPEGIDSHIGIDGSSLSLGQRQRLILARLFLRRPKLILLDEPTANMNPELEIQIMDNIYSHIDASAILLLVAHKEPKGIDFTHRYRMANGSLHRSEGKTI